jgi:Mor family transcriptional regulator
MTKQQRNINICELWDEGLTLVNIAKRHSISHSQVDRILKKLKKK